MAYGSDPNQFLDLRLPRDEKKSKGLYPTVINIHGGYWRAKYDLDHAGHSCAALTSKGLATANLEYRRVGNEGGAWPNTFAGNVMPGCTVPMLGQRPSNGAVVVSTHSPHIITCYSCYSIQVTTGARAWTRHNAP